MAVKKLEFKDYQELLHKEWADRVQLVEVNSSSPQQIFEPHQIGLCTSGNITDGLSQAKDSNLQHFVRPEKFDFEQELNSSALMAAQPDLFFRYPASAILTPKSVNEESENKNIFIDYEFKESSQKHPALILLEVELEKLTQNQSLISTVRMLADEMFTNAIYNAPFIVTESQQGADRGKTISLPEGKSCKIFLAKHDQRLVVGCADPFGTLNMNHLISKVYGCFKDGAASQIQMDSNKGAGIGTYMLFDSSTSIYVGVKPENATVFACVLPMNMSSKKTQELPKSFHFTIKGGD